MITHPDPERIRAYLDDLARLAVRHGLRVRRYGGGEVLIEPVPEGFQGYSACIGGEATLTIETMGDVRDLDPTRLSAHERLALRGSGPASAKHPPHPEKATTDEDASGAEGKLWRAEET